MRQLHRPSLEMLVCRVDVQEAFRQVPVDPAGAAAFSYVVDGRVVVDTRCQFGWRSSPGFWSLFLSALEYSHTHTTFQNASVTTAEVAAVAHVQIGPMGDNRVAVTLPPDCAQVVGDGGFAGSLFFVRYYVDDGVLVEGRFFADGRRCTTAVQSLATDHFRLLGNRGPSERPLLSPAKITHFQTRLEVLGWILDTQLLTGTMVP